MELIALDDWSALLGVLPPLLMKYGPSIFGSIIDFFFDKTSKGVKATAVDYLTEGLPNKIHRYAQKAIDRDIRQNEQEIKKPL